MAKGRIRTDYPDPAQRLRLTLAKTDHMRYTGHLDFNRTLERTFRRAGLPLTYTKGYTRRVKFNIASALPLGYTSEAEYVDVWLDERMDHDRFFAAFSMAAPPGIGLLAVEEVPIFAPSLQSRLVSAGYEITFLDDVPGLGARIEEILGAETLPRVWKKKEYDLRPLIFSIKIGNSPGQMAVKLSMGEGTTGRVSEVLSEMAIDPYAARVHRTHLCFS